MTVEEAAKRWGVRQTTVWGYIRKGFIIGIWSEKNIIHVPDISKPHIVKANMKRSEKNICNHIMKAIYNHEYIDSFIFGISEDTFSSAIKCLIQQGYISCDANRKQLSNVKCKLTSEWYERFKQGKNVNINFRFDIKLIPTVNVMT